MTIARNTVSQRANRLLVADGGEEMAKSGGSKTFTIGRNAGNGRFTTVDKARDRPATHVVERVPKPGRGDTKNK